MLRRTQRVYKSVICGWSSSFVVSAKQLEIEEIQDELHRISAKSENMVDR